MKLALLSDIHANLRALQACLEHARGQGAKYFRCRQPKQLIFIETGHDRSSATKREIFIKKLSRLNKLQLINTDVNKISGSLLGTLKHHSDTDLLR